MADSLETIQERMEIARCKAGDAAAFVEIVERYQPRLAYFLRKAAGDRLSVDDLLQDVWMDVFRSIGQLAEPAAFAAWIYRIARNRAYRELRRARVESTGAAVEDVAAPEADEPFAAEDVALVHECLDELGAEHREVLVLRFMEDMSYDDMAAVVDCSVGTVKSRLHYAKRALRAAINRRRSP